MIFYNETDERSFSWILKVSMYEKTMSAFYGCVHIVCASVNSMSANVYQFMHEWVYASCMHMCQPTRRPKQRRKKTLKAISICNVKSLQKFWQDSIGLEKKERERDLVNFRLFCCALKNSMCVKSMLQYQKIIIFQYVRCLIQVNYIHQTDAKCDELCSTAVHYIRQNLITVY